MDEIWRPVVEYEDYYEVSNLGRVRRKTGGQGAIAGRILSWHTATSTGYANVRLVAGAKAKGINVHKLVTRAFLGVKPAGMVTRHLDGNKLNNCISNLRYGTALENARDRAAHGNTRGAPLKLSHRDVADIRRRFARGESRKELASIYGVSLSHIYRVGKSANNRMIEKATA